MQAKNRTDALAGLFIVAGIALTLGLTYWLGELASPFDRQVSYTVRFEPGISVSGIKDGSPVELAGYQIGSVTAVELERAVSEDADAPAAPTGVLVTIDVVAGVPLSSDALVAVEQPLFGTLAILQFESTGSPAMSLAGEDPAALAAAGRDTFITAQPSTGLTAIIETAKGTLANVDSATQRIDTLLADLMPGGLPSAGTNIYDATAGVSTLIETVNTEQSPRVTGLLDSIDDTIDASSAEIPALIDELRAVSGDIRETAARARGFLASAQSSFDTIRPNIETVAEDAAELSAWASDRAVTRVDPLFATTETLLGNANTAATEAVGLVRANRPQVDAIAANTRLMTVQASLLLEEFRTAPWRFMQQPTEAERERGSLVAVSRRYATAVADLRATSERLDSVVASIGTGAAPIDPAEITRLRDNVVDAFAEYAEAEQRLQELLAESLPGDR